MPTPPTYPGVYVEELPSGARMIEGVATSITAFVGRTACGPTDAPCKIASFRHFEEVFGGLSLDSPLSYAVHQFFNNGGTECVIARVLHRDAQGHEDASAAITDADIADLALEVQHRGLWLLDQVDLFNLLCIPPLAPGVDVATTTWNAAIQYAKRRRAFVIVDPPSTWCTTAQAIAGIDRFVNRDQNAALYFPRVLAPDPLAGNQPRPFAPCGAIAGLYARTDTERGIWKAPAGDSLPAVTGLTVPISDAENGTLSPLAVNVLRAFPGRGIIAWGARTLAGTDALQSDYKYVPVRRLALFIEESLYRGLQWVAFEPNGEPLWAQIRERVATFLDRLWRQGAFQGAAPREAYFVKCGTDTTAQSDLDHGLVNIEIGFAPLKPAEFVIVRLQQLAAQSPA